MSTFYITKYEINNNKLHILTDQNLSLIDDIQIILGDRSSKKEDVYPIEINQISKYDTSITLDLLTVNFPNNIKNILNVYFLINNKKVRLKSKLVFLKNKNSRFSTDLFHINKTSENVAVPYLTINNSLSILSGNASIMLKTFCHNIIPKSINTYLYDNNKFNVLEFNNFTIPNNPIFLAFYNEETETYESLPYSRIKNNQQKIYIDKNICLASMSRMALQVKKRNNLLTFPLKFPDDNNKQTPLNSILTEKPVIQNYTTVQNVLYKNNIISFEIPNFSEQEMNNYQVYLKNQNNKIFSLDVKYTQKTNYLIFEIDLSTFITTYSNQSSRWSFHLKVKEDFFIEINRLGVYGKPLEKKYKRFFDSQNIVNSNVVTPYFTTKNGLSIVIKPKVSLHNDILQPIISMTTFQKTRSNCFHGKLEVEINNTPPFTVTSLMLRYRSKMESIEYIFETIEEKITKNKLLITFDIDVRNTVFEPGYWDFYLIVHMDNVNYTININNPIPELCENITKEDKKHIIKFSDRYILYPYITNNNKLSLTYRKMEKYEGIRLHIKEKIAFFIYNKFKSYFDKKQIWLIYEKFSETAQDNSYYFFKHVYDKHPDKNIFYIIDKKSPDHVNIKNMKDKVIPYMSIKHLVYLIASKLFISSESKGHAYILKKQNGIIRSIVNEKKFVFLRHGVSGFKNVNYIYMKHGNNNADLLVASSKTEKDIVINNMGYKHGDIVVTGLCRWDALIDKSKAHNRKEIILMPTWRMWLDDVSDDTFLKSDYYNQYTNLLNSKSLNQLLLENDITLHFFIHPKLRAYIDNFHTDNPNIKIYQFGEVQINHLLMHSSLLITDYSSVAWDFYYLKKPVLFYQFDYDMYEYIQGSYLDMNTELFGDRALDEKNLINLIEQYIKRGFIEKEKYASMRMKYFQYMDQNNCERTFDAIMINKEKLNIDPQ